MLDRTSSDTPRGNHRISATPPIFPSYLLPSFKFPFLRRRSSISPSPSTTTTTGGGGTRLTRLAPDTLRCSACSADLALSSQIISKGFTGRYGRALLVSPPPPSSDSDLHDDSCSLLNIRIGRLENRQLVTGWHVVADISCGTCSRKLGWKYVDAKEKSQRYKVGKYILETERVTTYRSWGDGDWDADEGDGGSAFSVGTAGVNGGAYGKHRRTLSDNVSFDSEDEDECDDIFAGTWDARVVAQRRAQMLVPGRLNDD